MGWSGAAVGALTTSTSVIQMTYQRNRSKVGQWISDNVSGLQWHLAPYTDIQNIMETASLLPLSKLHRDFSCHSNPEPHRKGDSAKCISLLAKVPQYKPPLFELCVVSAGKLVQCLSWVYTPDYWCSGKRQETGGAVAHNHDLCAIP